MENISKKTAVSPVIGVILMVAITVILAAVIAAFVFGMAGSIARPKEFAVTGMRSGPNIVITVHGGADQSSVVANSLNATATAIGGNLDPVVAQFNSTAVGSTTVLTMPDVTLKYNVVVTVGFNDGSSQVVLDTQL